MRRQRWVNRFFYAWNETLFFDPLDVYYTPRSDHFLSDFDEGTRNRFVRSGIWWSHRHNSELPAQGWKIHVSAGLEDVRTVVSKAVAYLTSQKIDFKMALDMNIYEMLNSKATSRSSGGKLITVYPRDDDEFRRCLEDLARLLEGAEGAYVLSDLRYKDHKALYFRYGQFLPTHSVDVLGRKVAHVQGPDGQPVPDERRVGYVQPSWAEWPFDDWKPEEEEGDGLLGGRFRVTGALQFSNGGGVYTAEDTQDRDRKVVLKEARPHTNPNPRQGHDAVTILEREWTFLNRLADIGSFPTPIAHFSHWEHHFIAEEFVPGTDLRSVLLGENPLARPGVETEGSRAFLRLWIDVFRNLARAITAAHERGVILGDLSPANFLIDTDTSEVTIIDLEACRLMETEEDTSLAQPVEMFTPGFSLSRGRYRKSQVESDQFGLATCMAYFIFPIAAMSYLRDNVLERFDVFTDALGWPAEIHQLILDLAGSRISLADVLTALADERGLLDQVDVPSPPAVVEEDMGLAETEAGVAAFVTAVADPERSTLFPVDPFATVTNPLSLGFGAGGVLWSLAASGVTVRPEWRDWLSERIDRMDVADYPDGLMSGLAGIAWAADSLGLGAQARELLAVANQRALEVGDFTFYYGLSGVGMTNLRFYLDGRDPRDLQAARECAQVLVESAYREDGLAYWRNTYTKEEPLTGLGFGQAGVALFLLRMYQLTGDADYVRLGREALAWEMAHVKELPNSDAVMFEHEGTMEPYVEVGSAGVLQVLLRYGDLDSARRLLSGLNFRFSVLPGYCFGLSGTADALLDAAEHLGDAALREVALRQLDYARSTFLFEPPERFGVPRGEGAAPLGVPGEGMTRCATDYLTGSAGVLRVLHRVNHGGTADFLLDEAVS